MIRSLRGNYTAEYRDHAKILERVKPYLKDRKFKDLERVYITGSPSLYQGHVTTEQRKINRDYGNHPSVNKNIDKVNKVLNKEDKNN